MSPGRTTLTCPSGHGFDQARQGYVQLTAKPLVHTGDSASMIDARAAFLATGHFDPITEALARGAEPHRTGDGLVLDVGAGTGHHLAGVLDRLPDAYGLATDVSKPAVRRAARAHPRADAILCDAWQPLPLRDGSVGVALNVFAPRPGAEFARVLRDDGVLLVVTPTAEHLAGLVGPLGLLRVDPDKEERVSARLDRHFRLDRLDTVARPVTFTHDEVTAVVGMGPSAWHADPRALSERIGTLPPAVDVTISVTLGHYRRR